MQAAESLIFFMFLFGSRRRFNVSLQFCCKAYNFAFAISQVSFVFVKGKIKQQLFLHLKFRIALDKNSWQGEKRGKKG